MPLPRVIRRLLWVWAVFGVFLVILVIAGIFLPSVGQAPAPEGGDVPLPVVRLMDRSGTIVEVPVELATTPEQLARGLMHRPVVTNGMLFEFADDAPRSFWMKNTLVPLDITFFTSTGTWVSSFRMEPCVEDPCASYPSGGPAMYALELPAGGIGESIGKGWKMMLGPVR